MTSPVGGTQGPASGELYWQTVLGEVPRILGLGDRNPASDTFGCFDRSYWHYRLVDFPNARFQEVALLLALLYQHAHPSNPFWQKPRLLDWIRAATGFWGARRNRDGSVSEAYPRERSYCATAFGFAAVTEVFLIFGWGGSDDWKVTADWLGQRDNPAVSNQTAAAALALFNWFLLTGDRRYRELARGTVEGLQQRQEAGGGFPEYGGTDVGYQTLTLGQLVRYYRKSKDEALREPLCRAVEFVEARVGKDGCFDRAAGSRRTQFLYPFGLAAMGSLVIARHIAGLRAGCALHPGWLDDRYVVQLSIDFLEAGLETQA